MLKTRPTTRVLQGYPNPVNHLLILRQVAVLKGDPDMPNSLMDLVAIATASDIVPMADEIPDIHSSNAKLFPHYLLMIRQVGRTILIF